MQINRPLIWILASYLAGILLMKVPIGICILIFCIILIGIAVEILHLYKNKSNLSAYYFLILLPLLFLGGYYLTQISMKIPITDSLFEEKIEVTLLGEVITIEEMGEYQRLTLNNVSLDQEHQSSSLGTKEFVIQNKVLVYDSTMSLSQYKIGNILSVTGTLQKFQVATNPGQFNEYAYYRNKKYDYKLNTKVIEVVDSSYHMWRDKIYRLKLKLKIVYDSILEEKQSGILSAMILGDDSSLDAEINDLYRQNGISHIIAISGLHVSLLGLTLYQLLRRIRIPLLPSTLASIFLLYAYGILTGFSVSTNRSIVMLVVYLISLLVGRTYDLLSGTALSALLILIQNPLELYNVGFLLSFGAIISVGTIFPVLKKIISLQNGILHSFLMSVSIQLVTTPILLYYFYEIPTYSVFINLLIIPLSSIVILLAVIAVILGTIYLPFGVFFIGGAHFLLLFFEEVCKLALKLPFRRIVTGRPNTISLVTYFIVLVIFLLLNVKKANRSSIILLLFTCILFIKPVTKELEVTFLDVGQGDGIVLSLPGDITFLIDGGSTSVSKVGKYRIEPFLKYKGITTIDYAVVTHTDFDHISGLIEIMEEMDGGEYISIKNLVLPDTSLKEDAYNALVDLAKSKGISCIYIKKDDMFKIKDIMITCLHPSKEFRPDSKNSYSTVLSLSYKNFDLLLTGDLEEEGEDLVEAALKNSGILPKSYEVLKVAHHGSKYSTKDGFLSLVKPEYAIISCGKNNSYGHPHEELLHRLETDTDNVMITYQAGAVTISTDGERMKVREYLE